MSDETFEGWSNRETWAVALHVNNDGDRQESVHAALRAAQTVREAIPEHVREQTETGPEGAAYLAYLAGVVVRESVEEWLDAEDLVDGTVGYKFHAPDARARILSLFAVRNDIGSLWRVDWTELGAAFLADLAEQSEAAGGSAAE